MAVLKLPRTLKQRRQLLITDNTVNLSKKIFVSFTDPSFVIAHGSTMMVDRPMVSKFKKVGQRASFIDVLKRMFRKQNDGASESNACKMFTLRTSIETRSLGKIILTSAYIEGYRHKAVPTIFLTTEQEKLIRENGVNIHAKLRKRPRNGETYICFPTESEFETIVSM